VLVVELQTLEISYAYRNPIYLKGVGLLVRHRALANRLALRGAVSALYVRATVPETRNH